MQPIAEVGAQPLLEFYLEAKEDRNESIKQGKFVSRDVEMVSITPPGSANHTVVKTVDEAVIEKYQRQYEAWKKGQDVDSAIDGTHLKMWPALSPAQVKNLLTSNIVTVEALACVSDGILQHLGPGALALKNKAKAYLEAANDNGKLGEKLAALEKKLGDLEAENAELTETVAKLSEAKKTRKKAA